MMMSAASEITARQHAMRVGMMRRALSAACSMLKAQLDDACSFVSPSKASAPSDLRWHNSDGDSDADLGITAQMNSLLSGLGYVEQQLDLLLTQQEDVFDTLVASLGPIATPVAATDAAELGAAVELLSSDPLRVVEAIEAYVQSLGSGVERQKLTGWRSLLSCSVAKVHEQTSLLCLPNVVEETSRLLVAVAQDPAVDIDLREAAFPSHRPCAELRGLEELDPVPVWTAQEKRRFAANIAEVRRLVARSECGIAVLCPDEPDSADPPLTLLLKRCGRLLRRSELLVHSCATRVTASECDRVCSAVLDSMLLQALDRVATEVDTRRMRELQLCCVAQSRMHEAARMWLDSAARTELEALRGQVADAQLRSDEKMECAIETIEAQLGQIRGAMSCAAENRETCLASKDSTSAKYRAFVMGLFQGPENFAHLLSHALASAVRAAAETMPQSLADVMQLVTESQAAAELRRPHSSDPDDPGPTARVTPSIHPMSGRVQPEGVLGKQELLLLHEALNGVVEEEVGGDPIYIPSGVQTAISSIEAVSRLFQWSDDMSPVTPQCRDMCDVYDIVRSVVLSRKVLIPAEPIGCAVGAGPVGRIKTMDASSCLGRVWNMLEVHEMECKSSLQGWVEALAAEKEFGAMSCAVALQLIQLIVSTSAEMCAELRFVIRSFAFTPQLHSKACAVVD